LFERELADAGPPANSLPLSGRGVSAGRPARDAGTWALARLGEGPADRAGWGAVMQDGAVRAVQAGLLRSAASCRRW